MKKYQITILWEIHDKRNMDGGYKTGVSTLIAKNSSRELAINSAIDFAKNLPSWEFERNGIDLEEYRVYPFCTYYYMTMISRILTIEEVE